MTGATLAFVFGSMLTMAVSDFIYRRVQMRTAVPHFMYMCIQATTFSVCVFLVALRYGVEITPTSLTYSVALASVGLPGGALLLRSLRHGDASVNVPICRLNFIVTAVAAILFLDESLRPGKVAAIVVAALSILLLANLRLLSRGVLPGGFGSLMGATLAGGIFAFIAKAATVAGISPTSLMIVHAPLVALGGAVFAASTGSLKPSRAVLKYAPICGVLVSSSAFLMLLSFQTGEASVNVPIIQLSFVVTSALAILFLGEPLTRAKVFGLALAAGSVLLFAL